MQMKQTSEINGVNLPGVSTGETLRADQCLGWVVQICEGDARPYERSRWSSDVTSPGVDEAFGISTCRDHQEVTLQEVLVVDHEALVRGNGHPVPEAGVDTSLKSNSEEPARVVEKAITCPGNDEIQITSLGRRS